MMTVQHPKKYWTEERKNKIRKLWSRWVWYLNLEPMVSHWVWKERGDGDDALRDGARKLFSVRSEAPYREATLTSWPVDESNVIEGDADDYLELSIIHEVMHVILEPIVMHRFAPSEYFTDRSEAVTEHLAHTFHEFYRSRRKLQREFDTFKRKRKTTKNNKDPLARRRA